MNVDASLSQSTTLLITRDDRSAMSLNSVVNNLVRAAAGIPADISDTDLDQHVAALLAKEAKEREMKWSEIGLGGLLGSSSERDT